MSESQFATKLKRGRGEVTIDHDDCQCPLWVKSRHQGMSASCPLYPQKRTLGLGLEMSALCQKQTFACIAEQRIERPPQISLSHCGTRHDRTRTRPRPSMRLRSP